MAVHDRAPRLRELRERILQSRGLEVKPKVKQVRRQITSLEKKKTRHMKLVEFQAGHPIEIMLGWNMSYRELSNYLAKSGVIVDYSTLCKWREALTA